MGTIISLWEFTYSGNSGKDEGPLMGECEGGGFPGEVMAGLRQKDE